MHACGLLDHIHTDGCGTIEIASIAGPSYCFTFTGNQSNQVTTFHMEIMSDSRASYLDFKTLDECQTDRLIAAVRIQRGGEYFCCVVQEYFKILGFNGPLTTVNSTIKV